MIEVPDSEFEDELLAWFGDSIFTNHEVSLNNFKQKGSDQVEFEDLMCMVQWQELTLTGSFIEGLREYLHIELFANLLAILKEYFCH